MSRDRVAILDLGSSKAACLAAELDESGELRIVGAASAANEGVRKGTIVVVEETASAADQAITEVERQTSTKFDEVSVTAGGGTLQGLKAQGYVPVYPRTRPISRDDVLQVLNHSRKMVLAEGREAVQAVPMEFRVDGRSAGRRPLGLTGGRLEVSTLLVTNDVGQARMIEQSVSMSGRRVEQFVLGALASGAAVLAPAQVDEGSAVVDIGAGSCEIGVFHRGAFQFTASVPIGGQHVTADVAKLLKTSPQEAESLKQKYGAAKASMADEQASVDVLQLGQIERRPIAHRVFLEIVEARMLEMAKLVRQQLERSGLFGMMPGGVTLTGGGSLLPGTAELFEGVLQHAKVRTVRPDLDGPYGELAGRPEMAASVGAALFLLEACTDELGIDGEAGGFGGRIKTFLANLGGR